uniref:Decaprenyl diphosphate synthase subunit 1 n=1 Tax=Colobus angolensis palliatus TaxID=336983 RepID=A0A2K5JZV2_COLAP
MSEYYSDVKGKAFRPIIVVLMAEACKSHHNNFQHVLASQRPTALIAEMIHTASLVHDDVIDDAIIEDLVCGEFLQLRSKENENERFAHYLEKTFKMTASLIANSCKAWYMRSPISMEKNVGIAFQLIDDVLDFTSCSNMGKPTSADVNLGLATGPVGSACQQFPEMNAIMIMRWFSLPGDTDRAPQYVLQSDGVQQTTYLAQQYCHEAIREISKLRPSPERDTLIRLSEIVLTRDK